MARNARPRKAYRPRAARAPMLVVWATNPEVGITERVSVDAFLGGWQTSEHFDCLADCRDILLLAADDKKDEGTIAVCKLAGIALFNLKDRYKATGRLVPTGDELRAMRVLADTSEDFWRRQSGDLYSRAYSVLQEHRTAQRAEMKQREVASADMSHVARASCGQDCGATLQLAPKCRSQNSVVSIDFPTITPYEP